MKRFLVLFGVVLLAAGFGPAGAQQNPAKTLLPAEVLRAIVNEASGELALQNEILLAGVNRNRKPEEYQKGYFETAFILGKLREYGVADSAVVDLPAEDKTVWDAETAELWIVEPGLRKIADLKEVPASLCSGSVSTDTTSELVYVGPGNREEFYKDRKVEGKIVLVNGYPDMARRLAVEKHGASGIVAWSSSHPEHDRDQVGWSSLRAAAADKPAFGFMVSERRGQELRDALERGEKIVVRAVVKTQQVADPRTQMTVGLIPGTEYPEEELVFTAHLFEGYAMQAANDNMSGCTAILETARVLRKLVVDGRIPPLRRSVRFLFVPEITGTRAYLEKFPEIARRFFANINHDMVGEGLVKNLSWFRLYGTPWSLPTYLNDVAASFVEWMGESQEASQERGWQDGAVLAPTGSRDPFYYRIEGPTGGSDHVVFIDGSVRVPAVLMNIWPDQWYHTGSDTPDKSDATQFKRVVAISAAAAVLLANAGRAEAEAMAAEVASRQLRRLGADKGKAERYLLAAGAKTVHAAGKDARNVVIQSFLREKKALESVGFFVKNDRDFDGLLAGRLTALEGLRSALLQGVDELYAARCRAVGVKPVRAGMTPDEVRLSRLVPSRTDKLKRIWGIWQLREDIQKLKYQPPPAVLAAESEMKNFIDGKRSVLEIRDAASAEFEPIPLADVEKWIRVYAELGLVGLKNK